MKTLAAALFAAVMAVPAVASATTVWDPVETEFVTVNPAPNPANIAAARVDEARLSQKMVIWDPVESELAHVSIAPESLNASALSTHDANRVMKRTWDPVESEFMMVPAY